MKVVVVVIVCLVALAVGKPSLNKYGKFEAFKKRFGKSYNTPAEEGLRFKTFLDNLKTIAEHNELYKAGKVSFKMGITQFADMTSEEYSKMLSSNHRRLSNHKSRNVVSHPVRDVPDSIDWRDYGYVTPVEDQGQCGSAADFSATGAVEGQNKAATGNLVNLDEQQLANCCGDGSCSGSELVDQVFQCIIDNYGPAADTYSVKSNAGVCVDQDGIYASVQSYVDVASGDEDALKQAVGTVGPVSVEFDASQVSFQLYVDGIYYDPSCSANVLDHAGLNVGYGSENGEDYWIIKNSWGTSWGEQGYIRMSRNRDNNCGIATAASYPVI